MAGVFPVDSYFVSFSDSEFFEEIMQIINVVGHLRISETFSPIIGKRGVGPN